MATVRKTLSRLTAGKLIGGAILLFVLIQLIPYGRSHINPPVVMEPAWNSPQTRELTARACYDCHSNETIWPWYSSVAPLSWLVQYDVDDGRAKLNYSEWNRPQEEARESAEQVQEGEMPPWYYLTLHAEARLTDAEKAALISGLQATFGASERRNRR